jgi:hypothetical protein
MPRCKEFVKRECRFRLCGRVGPFPHASSRERHIAGNGRHQPIDIGLNDHEHTDGKAKIWNQLVLPTRQARDRRSATASMGEIVIGRKFRILDDLRSAHDFHSMRAGLHDVEDRIEGDIVRALAQISAMRRSAGSSSRRVQ